MEMSGINKKMCSPSPPGWLCSNRDGAFNFHDDPPSLPSFFSLGRWSFIQEDEQLRKLDVTTKTPGVYTVYAYTKKGERSTQNKLFDHISWFKAIKNQLNWKYHAE